MKKFILNSFLFFTILFFNDFQSYSYSNKCVSHKITSSMNLENEVRLFYVTYQNEHSSPRLNYGGYYIENQLSKNIIKSKNWNSKHTKLRDYTTIEFKNKQGQIVLKRSYNSIETSKSEHDTYYVYDDYGNLVYVLSPEGSSQILNENNEIQFSILDALCYQYSYDTRNRLVERKIPGKGKKYIIYDKLDRPILTQDANQRKQNPKEWLFTKYDKDSRIIYTGLYLDNSERAVLQSSVTAHSNTDSELLFEIRTKTNLIIPSDTATNLYYTSRAFPANPSKIYTINYYDDYNWDTGNKLDISYDLEMNNTLTKKEKSIIKISKNGWDNGFVFKQTIKNDGYIQFTPAQTNKKVAVGLSKSKEKNTPFNSINYAVLLNSEGEVLIYESGILQPILTTYYKTYDVFKVERSGKYVLYKKNDQILHRSIVNKDISLYANSSFYDKDATLNDVFVGFSHSGQSFTNNTTSLKTGSKLRVLSTNKWITNVIYYNTNKKPIYKTSKNEYLKVRNQTGKTLDDQGRILKETQIHTKENEKPIIIQNFYTYNNANLLIRQEQQINNQSKELIFKNTYNSFGKVLQKLVGGHLLSLSNYTNKSDNVIVKKNLIIKNSNTTNDWNAGLSTLNKIHGDGYISYTITDHKKNIIVGLSYSDNNLKPDDINYAIQNKNGEVHIYESGIDKGIKTNYVTNDDFSIERRNNIVYYLKNREVFYISNISTTTNSMVGDIAIYDKEASIKNFVLIDLNKGLQSLDYSYTNKGSLIKMNDIHNMGDDLFAFKLNYNSATNHNNSFNKNISDFLWRTNNTSNEIRGYKYTYDSLNRIIAAKGYLNNNYDISNIEYDKNGNILKLQRRGHIDSNVSSFGLMDNLEYTYSGNQLIKVEEVSKGSVLTGFKNRVNLDIEYTYDSNGNIIKNLNKNIGSTSLDGIYYNYLNLPSEIKFGNSNSKKVQYIYDASGLKLQKTIINNKKVTNTDYIGNFTYEKNILQFIKHPEGYLKQEGKKFKYVYQYKDHLNNIRLFYTDINNDGIITSDTEIIQEKNYYPFGEEHKGYNSIVNSQGNSIAQKFGYRSKELNEEFGIQWYDYDGRNYNSILARWMNPDVATEQTHTYSPYSIK
ncbi:RHS repeat domain-containing protein [Tenacibaculum sp. M341]|uniref:RHS repeat domain-containing protein n=1 Tax=Tenacibaculum sp. M341 TaxID=2530339 RepID=UPI00104DC566|nr:hypothetical protein [Tenacibaculum sp. M341]TCI91375.1 hypothetical protein EYW44_10485 [Tenacibaculum sp. M341]